MDQKILEIDNLTVEFMTRNGSVTAVENVSFAVKKGETLGVIGESGSGKSVTSLALMRILDTNGKILSGELVYSGVDLKRASNAAMYDIRGREISMIFQNPRASLNPVRKIGNRQKALSDCVNPVLQIHLFQTIDGPRQTICL